MICARVKTRSGSSASRLEQVELRRRQLHLLAVDLDEVARVVDPEAAGGLRHRGRARAVELAPAQEGAHAAHELGGRERLRDVVVGAELEPEHAVDLGVPGREQDDRQVALGAQDAGRRRCRACPASSRRRGAGRTRPSAHARARVSPSSTHVTSKPFCVERVADRLEDVALVVGEQDAPASPSSASRSWKHHARDRAAPGLGLDRERAADRLGRLARDREPEAEAAPGSPRGCRSGRRSASGRPARCRGRCPRPRSSPSSRSARRGARPRPRRCA